MAFAVHCPACDRVSELADGDAGLPGACPHCGAAVSRVGSGAIDDLAFDLLTAGDPPGPAAPPPTDAARDDSFACRDPAWDSAPAIALLILIWGGAIAAGIIWLCLKFMTPRPTVVNLRTEIANLNPPAVGPGQEDFPPPPENPLTPPKDLDEALTLLTDPDELRRQAALEWLAETRVVPARQAEVGRAVLAVLQSRDWVLHEAAADVLAAWANPAVADELYGLAQRESVPGWAAALRALALRRDGRVASIAAAYLPNFFKRPAAARILVLIGPAAENEVIPYLKYDDPAVRREAVRLLGLLGTRASLSPLEAAAMKDPTLASAAQAAAQTIRRRKGPG
jgi:hypothetical protein